MLNVIILERLILTNKSHWHYASDKLIHDYQTDLNIRVKSFTLLEGIITCKNLSTCLDRPQITTIHDKIHNNIVSIVGTIKTSVKDLLPFQIGNLTSSYIEKYIIAWRKIKRHI